MPDRPVSMAEGAGRIWRPSADNIGWQIIIAETAEQAQGGLQGSLQREFRLADEVAAGGRGPTIFIWRSQRALIVARSQTRWPGFTAAAATLGERGWPVLMRRSGGGAFAVCPGTVQLAMMARLPAAGLSMDAMYERLGSLIGSALADFGIAAGFGDTPGAICDGRYDLVVSGRKIAGLAQHWRACGNAEYCVTAAASVLVDADVKELTTAVDRFYVLCGQAVDLRREAMTTVRKNYDLPAPLQRDLPVQFVAAVAAAANGEWRNGE